MMSQESFNYHDEEQKIIDLIEFKDWRQLSEFLTNLIFDIDLTTIRDKNGYTLILLACYKNSEKIVEILGNYVKKENQDLSINE